MTKTKHFDYKTIRICCNCNGKGVKNDETCPVCEGSGMIQKQTIGDVIIKPFNK